MLKVVPLFGSGVVGKSMVVTRQRRVNCYYEMRPDGDKAKVVVYGTPGLQLKWQLASAGNTPARALLGVGEASLYAVIANLFEVLNGSGVATYSAPIGTIQGLASMAANPAGSQIMLVDGVQGYVYTGGVLSPIVAGWFVPGAKTCTNVAGYFVSEYPNSAQFGASNINDATTGSALSFGFAAAYPDTLVAVDNLGGNLLLFCAQHMEFWQPVNTPPPSQPFLVIQSATNKWGLAAIFSRGQVDDSLIFLGETSQGTRRFCQIRGYVVTPISSEIDAIINQTGFVFSDAVALTYQRDKHPFYQCTFPTMGRTFTFDCSTGIWNEAQSGPSTGPYVRHMANLSTYYAGDTILSDAVNSNIYRMEDAAFTDNGALILREVVTRHVTRNFNRFRVPQIYIDMESGVGIPAGQGSAPTVSIEVSKDNGRTWFPARLIPLGPQGQYITRINARRFGQARVFTFRIRMTDPVKFVITDGALRVKGRGAA